MSPRSATTAGGTAVTIDGVFPTGQPIYVWFGTMGIATALSTGDTLFLVTPKVATQGVTDVIVKFTSDHLVAMTLTNAFTFQDPSGAGGGPVPAPTTTAPGAGGGTSTTRPGTPPTAPGSGGVTPTTAPATGGGTGGGGGGGTATTAPPAPGTTSPAPGGGGGTATTAAPGTTVAGARHSRLLPQPTSGALAGLSLASWPRQGCQSASCTAQRLP
jgi:hypothetical protein